MRKMGDVMEASLSGFIRKNMVKKVKKLRVREMKKGRRRKRRPMMKFLRKMILKKIQMRMKK